MVPYLNKFSVMLLELGLTLQNRCRVPAVCLQVCKVATVNAACWLRRVWNQQLTDPATVYQCTITVTRSELIYDNDM